MGELMNGLDSDLFRYYKNLLIKGFQILGRNVEEIMLIIDIMMEKSKLECFDHFDRKEFRERFKENSLERDLEVYVQKLIDMSYDNWRTTQYDSF